MDARSVRIEHRLDDARHPSPRWSALSDRDLAGLLLLGAIAIRFAALLVADNDDGDAMARILFSRTLYDNHELSPSDVWLPGHFAFLALPRLLGLLDQTWLMGFTALVSALAVPIAFVIARDLFDRHAALCAALTLLAYGLHIRYSLVTVAEGPFLTLVLLGTLLFLRWTRSGAVSVLLASVCAFNVASAMRFEGWILPFFLCLSWLVGDWMAARRAPIANLPRALLFCAMCCIVPLAWCAYSLATYGDALYFQHQTVATNALYFKSQPFSLGYTIAFFPGVLLLSMGVVGPLAVVGLVRCLLSSRAMTLALFLVLVIAFIVVQQLLQNLLAQSRYFLLICAYLAIFIGPGIDWIGTRTRAIGSPTVYRLALAGALAWPLAVAAIAHPSGTWIGQRMYALSPVPRFAPQMAEVDRWLRARHAERGAIVVALPAASPTYPWLSLTDRWYDTQLLEGRFDRAKQPRQLYFVRSTAQLPAIVGALPCGHVIVYRALTTDAHVDAHALGLGDAAFANDSYALYSWGEQCFKAAGNNPPRSTTTP